MLTDSRLLFPKPFGGLFNFGGGDSSKQLRSEPKPERAYVYKVPEERAAGRPHELGWLERLATPQEEKVRLGEVPAGSIISEE